MDPLHKDLQALGSSATEYNYDGADAKLLEAFPSPLKQEGQIRQGLLEIGAPEFTSLCPKTGQPDFANIVVTYMPDSKCVESKSFKLYLGSFRQARMFHEACVQKICDDLVALLDPIYLTVQGQFTPRGGIKFWPTAGYRKPMPQAQVAFIDLTQQANTGRPN